MADRTNRAAYKLIEELNKLKPQVGSDVWAEICQMTKVISEEGYKLSDEDNYAEMAGRIRKEAEKKVANRKRYAPYGNMEAEELVRAYCSSPELRIEFDSNFQWFVSRIIETFPDSPAQEFVSYTYLREFPNENLERMIRDRQQASTQKKEAEQPAETEQKKKGILRKLLKWLVGIIGAIVGFLAALFTCLGYLLGWLGPIKAFIGKILWPK